jgi:hypothetical protein
VSCDVPWVRTFAGAAPVLVPGKLIADAVPDHRGVAVAGYAGQFSAAQVLAQAWCRMFGVAFP